MTQTRAQTGGRVSITIGDSVIHSRSNTMSGAPVFKGTRVMSSWTTSPPRTATKR